MENEANEANEANKAMNAALLKIIFFALIHCSIAAATQSYPPHADVVDVTKPPYSANGLWRKR